MNKNFLVAFSYIYPWAIVLIAIIFCEEYNIIFPLLQIILAEIIPVAILWIIHIILCENKKRFK